jgi:hypothetical protein
MTDAANLLKRFGLIAEEDFAALIGISVKTLKNRPRDQLPAYVKVGRRRLFKEDAVRAYLEARNRGWGRRSLQVVPAVLGCAGVRT